MSRIYKIIEGCRIEDLYDFYQANGAKLEDLPSTELPKDLKKSSDEAKGRWAWSKVSIHGG
jgi:hypothetical protein